MLLVDTEMIVRSTEARVWKTREDSPGADVKTGMQTYRRRGNASRRANMERNLTVRKVKSDTGMGRSESDDDQRRMKKIHQRLRKAATKSPQAMTTARTQRFVATAMKANRKSNETCFFFYKCENAVLLITREAMNSGIVLGTRSRFPSSRRWYNGVQLRHT